MSIHLETAGTAEPPPAPTIEADEESVLLWDGRRYRREALAKQYPELLAHVESHACLVAVDPGRTFPSLARTALTALVYCSVLLVLAISAGHWVEAALSDTVFYFGTALAIAGVLGVAIHCLGLMETSVCHPLELKISAGKVSWAAPNGTTETSVHELTWRELRGAGASTVVQLVLDRRNPITVTVARNRGEATIWSSFLRIAGVPTAPRLGASLILTMLVELVVFLWAMTTATRVALQYCSPFATSFFLYFFAVLIALLVCLWRSSIKSGRLYHWEEYLNMTFRSGAVFGILLCGGLAVEKRHPIYFLVGLLVQASVLMVAILAIQRWHKRRHRERLREADQFAASFRVERPLALHPTAS